MALITTKSQPFKTEDLPWCHLWETSEMGNRAGSGKWWRRGWHHQTANTYMELTVCRPLLLSTSHMLTHWIFTAALRSRTIIPGLQLRKQLDNLPKVFSLVSNRTATEHTLPFPEKKSWLPRNAKMESPDGKTGFVVSLTFGDLGKVTLQKPCCSVPLGHSAHSTVSKKRRSGLMYNGN